jgi:uncharacterized damage-inducible protein DinB
LLADRVWLARFTGVTVADDLMGPGDIRSLDQELYADFEALRRERTLTDDALSAWVAGLTLDQLAAPLEYTRRGQKQKSPLWWAVAHLFNHQTHHRGQVHGMLSQTEIPPPPLDLIFYLREADGAR